MSYRLDNYLLTIKKQARNILCKIGVVSSLRSISARKQFYILAYHRINNLADPFLPAISSKIFEEQIHYCSRHYNVMPLEDVAEYILSGKELPLDVMAITFDDGYEDTFKVAYPVLKKYNLPATIFLTTDFLDRKLQPWFNRLGEAIKFTKQSSFKFSLNGYTLEYNLCDQRERLNTLKSLTELCRKISEDQKKELLSKIESCLRVCIKNSYPMLSWDMVREMCKDRTISIGAHTLGHPVLTRVPFDEARRQIALSKQRLEEELGGKIRLFAYPHGQGEDYSKEIKTILFKCGFIAACTTINGGNDATTDRYELKRINPDSRELSTFALQIGRLPNIGMRKLILNNFRRNTETMPTCYVLNMSLTGLSIVRSLGRHGVPLVAIDSNPENPALTSRYCRIKILPYVETAEEEWLKYLIKEGENQNGQKAIIIPAGDAELLFLSRNRNILSPYFRFALSEEKILESLPNKMKQYDLAKIAGIPIPETFYPKDTHELKSFRGHLRFPCLLKPAYSHRWGRVYKHGKLTVVCSFEDLVKEFNDAQEKGVEVLIQEFIPGKEDRLFCVSAYINNNGKPLAICSKQKLRQYPVDFGNGSLQITAYLPEIIELGLKFWKEINYYGLASIEFKKDYRDGKFKLMECNARLVSGSEIYAGSGVDLAYIAYCDLIGRPHKLNTNFKEGVKWLFFRHDYLAFKEYHKRGELNFFSWLWSLRGKKVYAYFTWDDPKPFTRLIRKFIWRCRHRKGLIGRIYASG